MKKLFIFLLLLSSVNLVGCKPKNESVFVVYQIEEISEKNDKVLYMAGDEKNSNSLALFFVDDGKKFNIGDTLSFGNLK